MGRGLNGIGLLVSLKITNEQVKILKCVCQSKSLGYFSERVMVRYMFWFAIYFNDTIIFL